MEPRVDAVLAASSLAPSALLAALSRFATAREAKLLCPFVAAATDVPALAELSLDAFGEEALSAATFRRRIVRGNALAFGLRDSEGIAAYLLLYLHRRTLRAYIHEALVVAPWRGRRLSTCPLAAAEGAASAAGMATLSAHVRVGNAPSLQGKLRQGMVIVGRLPAWYTDHEDAFYLRQRLRPFAAGNSRQFRLWLRAQRGVRPEGSPPLARGRARG